MGSCTGGSFLWLARKTAGFVERPEGALVDLVQLNQGSIDRPADLIRGPALGCVRAQQRSTELVNDPLPQGVERDMPTKKQKLHSSVARRDIAQRKQELGAVEAQIVRLERDPELGLASRDHFIVWKRPCLFAVCPSVIH